MHLALAVACLIGVLATWLGVLLAYDSYYWGSGHQGLPVSFFIVAAHLRHLPALRAARRTGGGRTPGPASTPVAARGR